MILLTLTACIDEPIDTSPEINSPHQLGKVKDWFFKNKDLLNIQNDGSNLRSENQELILPFFEKEPDWDQFHIYNFPDGREVYEISLANAEKYFPTYLKDSLQQSDPSISVVQNIMFVENKENGRFDPLIARYYPNNESSVRNFEEIYYNNIDNTWSGVVDIWTYDERHFISFTVQNGIIENHFFLDTGQDKNGKKIQGANLLTVDCFRVPTTVSYTYTTTGYYETTVEATQNYTTICSGGGSSGGGSSGGGEGTHTYNGGGNYGGSSGSATNPMPSYTPPPIPPPVVYVIDMRGLSKCHQDLIKALIGGTQQEIRRIFDKFNGDQPLPSNYNVKFQYGTCTNPLAIACTSP